MAKKKSYGIVFAPQVKKHLRAVEKKHHSMVRFKIDQQLKSQPGERATNRKPLRAPVLGADWELRCGPENRFRVLYDIDDDENQVVILAIGVKVGNDCSLRAKRWNNEKGACRRC